MSLPTHQQIERAIGEFHENWERLLGWATQVTHDLDPLVAFDPVAHGSVDFTNDFGDALAILGPINARLAESFPSLHVDDCNFEREWFDYLANNPFGVDFNYGDDLLTGSFGDEGLLRVLDKGPPALARTLMGAGDSRSDTARWLHSLLETKVGAAPTFRLYFPIATFKRDDRHLPSSPRTPPVAWLGEDPVRIPLKNSPDPGHCGSLALCLARSMGNEPPTLPFPPTTHCRVWSSDRISESAEWAQIEDFTAKPPARGDLAILYLEQIVEFPRVGNAVLDPTPGALEQRLETKVYSLLGGLVALGLATLDRDPTHAPVVLASDTVAVRDPIDQSWNFVRIAQRMRLTPELTIDPGDPILTVDPTDFSLEIDESPARVERIDEARARRDRAPEATFTLLRKLLADNSEDAQRIQNACRLFLRAHDAWWSGESAMLAACALEALLLAPGDSSNSTARLKEAVAMRCGSASSMRAALRQQVEILYDKRSRFVHRGELGKHEDQAKKRDLKLVAHVLRLEIIALG